MPGYVVYYAPFFPMESPHSFSGVVCHLESLLENGSLRGENEPVNRMNRNFHLKPPQSIRCLHGSLHTNNVNYLILQSYFTYLIRILTFCC